MGSPGPPLEGPPASVVQFPPPELALYPAASNIYGEGNQAGIANGTTAVVAVVQLAGANVGVVNSLIIFGNNVTAALVATWTFRVNGSGLPGSTRRLPSQTSSFGAISWGPDEVLFRLPQGAILDVLISVTAGGPAELGAQFSGWEYPLTIQDRFGSVWE